MITFNFHLDIPYKRDADSIDKIKKLKKLKKPIPKNLLSEKETAIYLLVTIPKKIIRQPKAKIIKLHTAQKISPRHWDFKMKLPNKDGIDNMELTDRLEGIRGDARKAYSDYIRTGTDVSPETLAGIFEKVVKGLYYNLNTHSIYDVFDTFLENYQGIKTEKTKGNYTTLKNILKEFETVKKYHLTFDSINAEFYNLFKKYLLKEKKNKRGGIGLLNNTVRSHIICLTTFLQWSAKDYHKNTFYTEMTYGRDHTEPISLEHEEFTMLLNHEPSTQELRDTKNIFVFQLLSGQRYGDVLDLEWADIRKGIWYCYQGKGRKTTPTEIPLHPIALKILHEYDGNQKPLPVPNDNFDYNESIRLLAEEAGINAEMTRVRYSGVRQVKETGPKFKFMTSHICRKTFINIAAELGIEMDVTMSITGHTNFETVQEHYRKVSMRQKQKEVNEKMNFEQPVLKIAQ